MRNPAKNRNAAAAWLIAFAGVAGVMYVIRSPGPAHGWPDVVMVFAVSFAGLALFAIPFYQLEAARYTRLTRGEDVLARWTVAERDWKHFVLEEAARRSDTSTVLNIIELKPRVTPHGVDIVIGKDSIMIGDDFHSLPRAGLSRISGPVWVQGIPPCLEFTVASPNTTRTTSTHLLRFPVAAGAQAAAEVVKRHYETRAPELAAQRDPKRMRGIGVAITGVGAIALVFGLLTFKSNVNPSLLVALLVGGVLVTPAGLLIAFVWHRRMGRPYKKYPY